MQTRSKLAELGFGFMRLPLLDANDNTSFDYKELYAMVDTFIGAGFSYFDTARSYHSTRSEEALRKSVIERYPRESYEIATKVPIWLAERPSDGAAMLETSLETLGLSYIDYFLLHNLGEDRTKLYEDFGFWDMMSDKKRKGKLRNIGFSFHDKASALDELLAKHPEVDFVQLQINYADWESDDIESRKCYEVAQSYDLDVVVMEPVKGGSLVRLPEQAKKVLRASDRNAPLASWALRFAGSLPGVTRVLSGMSNLKQVEENVRIMKESVPLTFTEYKAIDHVRQILNNMGTIPCTACNYCLDSCPQNIRIPTIMTSLNIVSIYNDKYRAQENYNWNALEGNPASACIACKTCENVCPQHIDIIKNLERASKLFD